MASAYDSILNTVKANLGIEVDYEVFDGELIPLINGALINVTQLGIGKDKFELTGKIESWADFLGDTYESDWSMVATYVYLKVRLMFDPPTSSSVQTAFEKLCSETEFRLIAQTSARKETQ